MEEPRRFVFLYEEDHVDILSLHKHYADANAADAYACHFPWHPTTIHCSSTARPLGLSNECDI